MGILNRGRNSGKQNEQRAADAAAAVPVEVFTGKLGAARELVARLEREFTDVSNRSGNLHRQVMEAEQRVENLRITATLESAGELAAAVALVDALRAQHARAVPVAEAAQRELSQARGALSGYEHEARAARERAERMQARYPHLVREADGVIAQAQGARQQIDNELNATVQALYDLTGERV